MKYFLQHTMGLKLQKPLQDGIKEATLRNANRNSSQTNFKVTCRFEQLMNIASELSTSLIASQAWTSLDEVPIYSKASTSKSISFASLRQL